MPVSHIGLTVSHLPTSSSFFLCALQPLGYRYIGQQGNQIGLGIRDADFFLCQETPGVKAGAAHIAFTAPSRSVVRDFYAAALNAGGRPNGAPASRSDEDGHFNAAVLDFDGNSIEVVFRNAPDIRDDGTIVEHSRVITWQRTVSESFHDGRSVVSSRTTQSSSKQDIMPALAQAVSKAPSVVSKAPSTASKPASVARSVSAPVAVPQTSTAPDAGDGAAKKIIGTLLGAAAGAAVAYAMVRSEQDSAKKEADFNAFQKAKAAVTQFAQTSEQPRLSMQDPQQIYETQPSPLHRNISDTDSHYASPQARSVYAPRAIEPAPPSYHSPSYTSAPPTQVGAQRAIEYHPPSSVGPTRSHFAAPQRSVTSPELLTIEKARSTVSKVHSVAPSTLISSFVPDHVERRSSEGSIASHHSGRSKARSSHTHASRHSKHTSSRSRAPSPQPSKVPSKAGSIVSSILGRDNKSTVSSLKDPFTDAFEVEDADDCDTVAPSDSISNAGSSSHRSHRSHRSRRDDDGSVANSRHSSGSRHSKSSKHSSHSRKSHSSRSRHSEYHDADERLRLPSIISEPSDASTVKPIKSSKSRSGASESGSRHSSRKDSLMQEQYEGSISGGVTYGEIPIRGITPSMIGGKEENKSRTMASYAHMQKLKAFEQ
ncbi:hypothetical protein K458DRAFT_486522 [Lentithecium fluviatile CBS 122367]|uniref:VOC domain-containing protein n=1 Tax=Lentithecium fluviatile CBS 122367 TaxID=1168545 RepID=A0A6G1J578_9PLEO|nr:hypothetical protein K458DRAFT_486522 [Lentithecium fluviatile CBS 122367]